MMSAWNEAIIERRLRCESAYAFQDVTSILWRLLHLGREHLCRTGSSGRYALDAYSILNRKKTRDHLDGPFWSDYLDSLEGMHGWNNPQRSIAKMMRIERPSHRDTRTNYR
jgi:hypothetical protein